MRRLALELGVLGTMVAVAAYNPDLYAGVIGFVLLPVPIIQWAVWGYLATKVRESKSQGLYLQPLVDRANDARTLAEASTAATIAGILVLLRQFEVIGPVDRQWYLVILSFCLLMLVVPALVWLRTWRAIWLPALHRQRQIRKDNDALADAAHRELPPPQ